MAEIGQRQEPEAFPTDTAGNASRPPSREEDQGNRNRANRATVRKATGPRTAQGKNRSKLNALKHGLFSKDVLLGRSRDPDCAGPPPRIRTSGIPASGSCLR